jgi:hypothetical protein
MCLPTTAPCTTQLPMSRQVCAPQFYQRMTARSIFDRCGDRRIMLTFQPPIRTPRHEHEKCTHLKNVFADRSTTYNPTPHFFKGNATRHVYAVHVYVLEYHRGSSAQYFSSIAIHVRVRVLPSAECLQEPPQRALEVQSKQRGVQRRLLIN